jgi:hypothetical protein
LCLTSKQLREISVRRLYREVTIDVGSSKDTRLAAFLNPKNIGLQHIRKLDLYLTDVLDKCNQIHLANLAVGMILELLPENILEKFSWHPWSPFSGDHLVLLYKKQKRMKWAESIALDRNVLDELQKIPDFKEQFANVRKVGLYPDSREVLDYCHFILKHTTNLDKVTLHASFDDSDVPIQGAERLFDWAWPDHLHHVQPHAAVREVHASCVEGDYATEAGATIFGRDILQDHRLPYSQEH